MLCTTGDAAMPNASGAPVCYDTRILAGMYLGVTLPLDCSTYDKAAQCKVCFTVSQRCCSLLLGSSVCENDVVAEVYCSNMFIVTTGQEYTPVESE